jgi:tetratricopeptide (TPR) repeat protein
VSLAADFCPYVGLQPYTDKERDYFFGRQRDQRIIASNLYASSLTVLYGESGVGKSSILLAGVAPYLRSRPRTAVVVFREWQRADFLAAIKSACVEAVERAQQEPLDTATTLPLDDLLCTAGQAFGGSVLVLFDQFEEYFLYHPESDPGNTFDREFARAVNREDVDAGFLITIREDALSKLDRFRARIPSLLGNTLRLQHLSASDAEESIRKPLDVFNARGSGSAAPMLIEDELVQSVLAQVRTGQVSLGQSAGVGQARTGDETTRIEAPFLQLVMTRLWEEEEGKSNSHILRASTLQRLGGAQQIVASHLDSVMAKLGAVEQEVCSRFFDRLVTPSGSKIACGVDDLTKWAGDLASHVPAVLQTLSDSRLLRGAAASALEPQTQRFEIFHDVLAPAVLAWRTRYIEARQRAEAERRLDEQRRRTKEQAKVAKRLRRLSLALLAVAVLTIGAAFFAWVQRNEAERQRGQAESERRHAETLLGFLLGEKFLGEVRDVGGSTMLVQVREYVENHDVGAGDQRAALNPGLALRNAGDVERTQGNLSESLKFFEQALEFFESSPDDPASWREAARTHERMGEALSAQGQVTKGLSHYEAAVKAWRQVVATDLATDPEAMTVDCTSLADSLVSAGDLKYRMGEATLARTDLEEALKIATTLLVGRQTSHDHCRPMAGKAEPYPDAKALEVFSNAVMLRAQILNFREDYDGAPALAMEARRLRPTSVSARKNALVALVWRGDGRIYDQPQSALDDYRNALAGYEKLRRWDPDNRLWQRERAAIQLKVSEGMVACHESKTNEEAEASALEAIATLRTLAGIDPTNFSLQRHLGWALQEHARVLASQDRKAERLARLEESERFYINSIPDPADAGGAEALGGLLLDKVDALAVLDRQAEAEATLQRSIGLFEGLIAAHQDNSTYVNDLSAARRREAEIRRKTGDGIGADAADLEVTRLNEQYQKTTESNNQKADKQYDLHIPHADKGATLFNGRDYTAALDEFKAAESSILEYIWLRPTDFRGYDGLRNIYRWTQLTQKELGKAEEGTAAVRASMYAAQIAALLAPENNEITNNMLQARHNLGVSLYDNKRLDEALAMVQEELVIAEGLVQGPSERVNDAEHRWRLGDAKYGLGMMRRGLKKAGWKEALQSALIHVQKAVVIDTKNPRYQKEVGSIRKYLAEQLDVDGLGGVSPCVNGL